MLKYRFTNRIVFDEVLYRNPEVIVDIVNLFYPKRLRFVRKVEKEHEVEITPSHRGVRFDIYAEDEEGNLYVLEMQMYRSAEIKWRMRLYQGAMDLEQKLKGEGYRLHDTILIFICDQDLLGEGKAMYELDILDRETHKDYGFGMHWIMLNASGDREKMTLEQNAFLDYIKDGKATDALTNKLEKLSELVNAEPSVLKEIMTQEEIIRDAKMEALEEGKKQEEIASAIRHTASLAEHGMGIEEAMTLLDLPEEVKETVRKALAE